MDWSITLIIAAGTLIVSGLNAAIGPTGGVQLALVASLLPPQLSIPIHGVISGSTSLVRFVQLRKYVDWKFFWRFIIPSSIGTLGAGLVFVQLDERLLLASIGLFILVNNFVPYKLFLTGQATNLMDGIIGLITGFLTVFVGATGPAVFTYIAASDRDRYCVIATDAACMTVQHMLKIVAFIFISFLLLDYIIELSLFVLAGVIGTTIGVRVIHIMSEKVFRYVFKTATTIVGFYLILSAAI